ncbi:uncharacterized protein LOC120335179 [Styela clava]
MLKTQNLIGLTIRIYTRTIASNCRLGNIAPKRKDIENEPEMIEIRTNSENVDKHEFQNDLKNEKDLDSNLAISKMHENVISKHSDLPVEAPKSAVGFWNSERGLAIKESALIGVGRVLRMYFNKERYDNLYEAALGVEKNLLFKLNEGDEDILLKHGPEWALGDIVFSLGGAVKLRYDDRWVDDPRCLRTPKRKDFRLEGIDLRKSAITWRGLRFLEKSQFVRYVNVGDAKYFDDTCMSTLHPTADSLEFLDVSGTAVTEKGLSYLRMFPKLKYLNLSRLHKAKDLDQLLPFLFEILPENCAIIADDETSSDMYGSPIPYRSPYNPKKDQRVIEGNKNIGDLVSYDKDMGAVDFYRPETIHELWMTPKMSQERKLRVSMQPKCENNLYHRMTRYILKAHDYKPLL